MLTTVAASFEPFTISLHSFGTFPKWKKPRVLWIGISDGLERYKSLVSTLKQEWKKHKVPGLDETLKIQPHLTIGRWNDVYVNSLQGEMVRDVLGMSSEMFSG